MRVTALWNLSEKKERAEDGGRAEDKWTGQIESLNSPPSSELFIPNCPAAQLSRASFSFIRSRTPSLAFPRPHAKKRSYTTRVIFGDLNCRERICRFIRPQTMFQADARLDGPGEEFLVRSPREISSSVCQTCIGTPEGYYVRPREPELHAKTSFFSA